MLGLSTDKEIAVSIKGLSKYYKNSLRENKCIINNLSLDIYKGDCVGIIGSNGAGKTTLLKIISGLVKPSEGLIQLSKKTVSVLELGQHLISDLTGRDNLKINMSIYNIAPVYMEQIISFSGLDSNIDLPVKNYSSGMLLRLGFSIFIHVEADLYLFDEVIAVGDNDFKKKCYIKFKELMQLKKTFLFASHDLDFIAAFCNKTLLLEKDRWYFSFTNQVLEKYLHPNREINKLPESKIDFIYLIDVIVGNISTDYAGYSNISITVLFKLFQNVPLGITLSVFKNDSIAFLSNGITYFNKNKNENIVEEGIYKAVINLDNKLFNSGEYTISLDFHNRQNTIYNSFKNVANFSIPTLIDNDVFDNNFLHQKDKEWRLENIAGLKRNTLLSIDGIKDELYTNGYVLMPKIPEKIISDIEQHYQSLSQIQHLEDGKMISILSESKIERKEIHDKLIEILHPYLSQHFKDYKVFIAYYIVKKVAGDNLIGAHQEPTFVDTDLEDDFTLWFPLQDVLKKEEGMLCFYKGSHLWANKINCKNYYPEYLNNIDNSNILTTVPTERGQPVLFLNRCIHASTLNTKLKERIAISIKICSAKAAIFSYFYNHSDSVMEMYKQDDNYYFNEDWNQDIAPDKNKFIKKIKL